MNRSARQLALFEQPSDYRLFMDVLAEAQTRCPIRLLEYCVMPNHWHLLVWPETDGQLSRYMRWITGVHGQRWRRARGEPGRGAVYQGRFRWVAVQNDTHYEIARQYIRQNPVRARLVADVADWPWSSAGESHLSRRPQVSRSPLSGLETAPASRLDPTSEHLMRDSLRRSQPFGDAEWARALEVEKWLAEVLRAHTANVAPDELQKANNSRDRLG